MLTEMDKTEITHLNEVMWNLVGDLSGRSPTEGWSIEALVREFRDTYSRIMTILGQDQEAWRWYRERRFPW